MRPHSQFPTEDKGRRSSQPMTTSVNWRNGQRAAAWEELWRRILAEVLPGEHVVTVHDHTREKSQTDEYTREPDRDKYCNIKSAGCA